VGVVGPPCFYQAFEGGRGIMKEVQTFQTVRVSTTSSMNQPYVTWLVHDKQAIMTMFSFGMMSK